MSVLAKLKVIYQQLFHTVYPREMVTLFVDATNRSTVANFSASLVFVVVLCDYIPYQYLIAWALLQITLFSLRITYKNRLAKKLRDASDTLVAKCINTNVLIVFLGGVSWGIASVGVTYYANNTDEFLMLMLLVGLTAGAMATLSPVYRSYALFLIPSLGTQVMIALFLNDTLHYLIAFIVLVYAVIVTSAGNSVYSHMRSAILFKNQLKELNASLEERVAQEREKNLEQTRLMFQQSRHAQMGEMISMIAHQWRQPLTSLSASVSNLEVDVMLDKMDQKTFLAELGKITVLTKHLSETVDDFRGFFKEDKNYDVVSVESLLQRSIKIVESSLKNKKITLVTDFQATKKVRVLANEMRQVILNLIKNSEDALEEHSVEDPCIRIESYMDGMSVCFAVEDNAGGIEASIMETIFDAYFTTKGELNGTGLGLYMSKTIVEEHSYGILSVSNTQVGARFEVKLPTSESFEL